MSKKTEKDAAAVKAEKQIIKGAWISVVIGMILMILGKVFEGNPLFDFMSGALPGVLLGLMIVFAALYLNLNKEDNE